MPYKQSAQGVLFNSRPNTSILDFDRQSLIDRILQKLENKNVDAAYIFGSFATETSHVWSDIDLIIVKACDKVFVERPRDFFDLFDLNIPIDILVYTSDEFAILLQEKTGFWHHVRQSMVRIL